MNSIQLYEESLREGAAWLGVGIFVVILAMAALSVWLMLQATRGRPVVAGLAPDTLVLRHDSETVAPTPVGEDLIVRPEVQDEIRALQRRLSRGEIDQATYRAELARLCEGRAA